METSACFSSTMEDAVPWSELPDDLLAAVASMLPSLGDLFRFRAVCRSWRQAAADCAPPLLPYMMFSPKEDFLTRCIYSLSDGRVHRIGFPEEARSWRCCGSSHGWLVMTGLDASVRLFNPMSGARLELPPLTTLSQVLHVVTGPETDTYAGVYGGLPVDIDGGMALYPWYVVDSTEGYPWRWSPEELRDDLVQKVVVSPITKSGDHSDCIAMMLYSDYKIAYARLGDKSWTNLSTWNSPWFSDLVHHDDKFYLLTWNYSVWAVDFAGVGREPRTEDLTPKRKEAFLKGEVFLSYLSVAHPSGALFLVHRRLYREKRPRKTEAFQVWKLEVRDDGSWWVEADGLDGCTLFLAGNCSTSVAAAGGGCAPDSIYFAADNLEFCDPDEESACVLEGGRYHLKHRTMQSLLPSGCDDIQQHPVWFTPTL